MKNNLSEALVLVEELEQDGLQSPDTMSGGDAMGGGDDMAADMPPPSEPPVSDEAVGADTQGDVAIQLLSDIRDLLGKLAGEDPTGAEGESELGGEGAPLPGEGGEGAPLPGEGDEGGDSAAIDAIPEVPEDESDEDDEEDDAAAGRKASAGDDN